MSDFIKMKSSVCLALYHLEGLSYMLYITIKAIYNQFKGLVFMISASPSAARGASKEETAALLGQHRGPEEPTPVSRTVSSCCPAFPFPTEVPVLSGSLRSAPLAPGAVQAVLPQPCQLCWVGGVVCRKRGCSLVLEIMSFEL